MYFFMTGFYYSSMVLCLKGFICLWHKSYGSIVKAALLTGFGAHIISCTPDNMNNKNQANAVEVVRFEQKLFNTDIYALHDTARLLLEQYPDFVALFSSRIIEIGDTASDAFSDKLLYFVSDKSIYELAVRTKDVFADFSDQQQGLNKGLVAYQKNFPAKPLPVVYTYVSGLNQSIVTGQEILGISLDKYLGVEEPLYDKVYPPIPQYIRQNMQPVYIVSDALKAWVLSDIDYQPEKNTLLTQILYEGKAFYITKQLLPEVADSLLWGFTAKQFEFCTHSEKEMWTYLIDQRLLFTSDRFRIAQFTNPGPFTKEFTSESPARAAVWIGYRIVESYMQRNKSVSLPELAASNNYQDILNQSRYNP